MGSLHVETCAINFEVAYVVLSCLSFAGSWFRRLSPGIKFSLIKLLIHQHRHCFQTFG